MALVHKFSKDVGYVKLTLAEEADVVRAIGDLLATPLNRRDEDILSDIVQRFMEEGSNIRQRQLDNLGKMLAARGIDPIKLEFDGECDRSFGAAAAERRNRLFEEQQRTAQAEAAASDEPEPAGSGASEVFEVEAVTVTFRRVR